MYCDNYTDIICDKTKDFKAQYLNKHAATCNNSFC